MKRGLERSSSLVIHALPVEKTLHAVHDPGTISSDDVLLVLRDQNVQELLVRVPARSSIER
eukprot:COSAG06_NODE_2328_length_7076_cov_48.605274_3_plen_61_part_00